MKNLRWRLFHIDPPLLLGIIMLFIAGGFILFSASNENSSIIWRQSSRFIMAILFMIICAQIPPHRYYQWAPWLFTASLLLLVIVLVIGHVDAGAKRWLHLGPLRLQPSELMKITLPLMLSRYLSQQQLPPTLPTLGVCGLIIAIPVLLTVKQPDLGTGIIIASTAFSVLLLAGLNWRYIISLLVTAIISAPIMWHFMHAYQKARVLIFLNPERDPLGRGYHIIQSKIAIGSGGLLGKGWLAGTQSHLAFLPAHTTDFIFAVCGEELGLMGCCLLLLIFLIIFLRCLYISTQAQTTFSRLLAGSLSITFILSAIVNISMVIGILPVVGIPLPLVSYGGSALVITLLSFGIIMSIHTHRKLWSS